MSEGLRQEPESDKPRGAIDVIMGRFIIKPFRRIEPEDVYQTKSLFPREGIALPEDPPQEYKEADV